jgi:hypothetical protein
MNQLPARAELKNHEIQAFTGLITGAAKGTEALGFRVLDNFVFTREVNGLALAPSKQVLFTENETVQRFIVLWDGQTPGQTNPTIYTQTGVGIRYRFQWTTASGTLLSYGTDFASKFNIQKIWRGKMGVLQSANQTYGAASAFKLNFMSTNGFKDTTRDPAFTATVTAIADPNTTLAAGDYRIAVLEAKKILVGFDEFYVLENGTYPSTVLTLVAGQAIQIAWTSVDAVVAAIIPAFTNTQMAGFETGVLTTNPSKILSFDLLGGTSNAYYPYSLMAYASGQFVAYRFGRTWIAGNTVRANLEKSTSPFGVEDKPNPTTSTLYYSNTETLWGFPKANFINLAITGSITGLATLGNLLIVFSESEVWAISGNTDADFYARKLDIKPGCINQDSLQEWRGVLFFLARDGIYAMTESGQAVRVSDGIRDVFLNMGNTPTISSGIDRLKAEYLIAINGVLYVYDIDRKAWMTRGTANWVEGGNVVSVSDGAVVSALNGTSQVTGVMQTEFFDFGMPEVDKFFRQVRLAIENNTAASCTITVQPIKPDGTNGVAPASQVVLANTRARLNFGLRGQSMVGRGLAFKITIVGLPGVLVRPDISIQWRALGERGR